MRRLTVNLLESLPDEELMLRVGRGEHAAFDILYKRYARRLGGFFLRMLVYDSEKAEDMLQELFISVWSHRKDYHPTQPFTTWIYAMAYNLCKNDYRHTMVHQAYETECKIHEEATDDPTQQMERNELRQRIRHVVQMLPEAQRDAFLLHYDEELTVAEVAHITGSPEGTVKSRIYTALANVREKMKIYK